MREIEVKILEIDIDSVISKLKSLGAKKSYDKQFISYYYDYKDERLKENKSVFRLRKEEKINRISFKKFISKDIVKDMEEIECLVDDFENFRLIMKMSGFIESNPFQKRRISYKLKEVTFDIDTYPRIPPFLEIEADSYETIVKYAELLGFKKEQLKPWNSKELFKHYGEDFL